MHTYAATIANIVDGDTLDADIDLGFRITVRQRVRLHGIDAPELHGATAAAGKAAREYLAELLRTQMAWQFQTIKPRDKYGRWLATIDATDPTTGQPTTINRQMIEAGHAVLYLDA
jgi:endonuclease YncB( thermonuclease family)